MDHAERCPRSTQEPSDTVDALHLHFSSLYDEDGDVHGERIDPANGIPIDNATYTGLEDVTVHNPYFYSDGHEDVLPPIDESAENIDPELAAKAAEWLSNKAI